MGGGEIDIEGYAGCLEETTDLQGIAGA